MTGTTTAVFPIPPFGNPEVGLLVNQIVNSAGVPGGLAQYMNQALGEAVNNNAITITFAGGATQILPSLDHGALVNATGGAITTVMPPIGGVGRLFEVVKTDSSANTVTITAPAGSTFADGTTTFLLYSQNDYVDVLANAITGFYHIRGFRQRSASNTGGFAGAAGCAQIQQSGLNQSISNNTLTTVQFTFKNFDTGLPNPYWNSASPNVLTAPVKGIFQVTGSMEFTAATESAGEIKLYLIGGGGYGAVTGAPIAAAGQSSALSVSGLFSLTSGQVVSMQCLQNSTGSININSNSANSSPVMSIVQVG